MILLQRFQWRSAKNWQIVLSAALLVISSVTLVGWIFNIPTLKNWLPGLVSMKVNTAIGFVLIGVSLLVLRDEPLAPTRRRLVQICAAVIFLLGFLTLVESVFRWNLGIDELLFRDTSAPDAYPGRMSEAGAFAFILLAYTLWLLSREKRITLAQFVALVVLGMGEFSLVGYLYGAEALYRFFIFDALALPTAISLVLSSMAILLTRPQNGLMRVLSTSASGGVTARRLLPAAILIPVIIGWLRLKGQELGLYGTEIGLALFALSNVITFTLLIWWNARLLNEADAERRQGAENISKLNRTLAVLSDINQAIVRLRDLPALYERVCQIAVDTGGFRVMWLGMIDPTTQKLTLAAHAGKADDYQDVLMQILSEEEQTRFSLAQMVSAGTHIVIDNVQDDPRVPPVRQEQAKRLGFHSAALLPLKISGAVCGLIGLYSQERSFFDAEELKLVDEMADDIAFAMEFAEQEKQRQQAQGALLDSEMRYRRALDNLIEGAEILGFDWRYLYVNNASAGHGRQPKDVLLRSTVIELYPGIEDTELFAHLRACMEDRIPEHFESEFLFPDGYRAWFDLSVQPVPEGIFILSLDITERKRAEVGLQSYAQRLEILHVIDQGIIQGGSIQQLAETTLNQLRQVIQCQRANVRLIDEETGEGIIFALDFNGDSTLNQILRDPVPPDFLEDYDARHMLVVDDLRPLVDRSLRAQQFVSEGMISCLTVLLMDQDRPIGTLGFLANTPAFFTSDYQQIAIEVASQLVIAVRQMRLTEALAHHTAELEQNNVDLRLAEANIRRYSQRIEILHTLDQGIIQAQSIPALIEVTLKNLRQVIPCQRANVIILDEATNEAVFYAVDLDGETALGQGTRFPPPPDARTDPNTRSIQVVDDIRAFQDTNPRAKQFVSEGLLSSLYVPLMDQDDPIGTLGLLANTPAFFTPEYQQIAAEIADQLAIAVRQMKLTEEIERHTLLLEQRIAERTGELQAAKDRAEAILNNSTDGIVLADANLRIRQTNPAFDSLFASEPDETFKRYLLDFIHPEDASPLVNVVGEAVRERTGKYIEVRCVRSDLTSFEASFSISYFAEGEGREGIVCVIQDITERKREQNVLAEERNLLRTLIDTTPDFIYIKDLQHRFLVSNVAHAHARGEQSPDELIGKTDADFFPSELAAQFHAEEEEIFRTGQALLDYEQPSITENRGFAWASSNKVPLHNLRGELIGIVGITHDITERKRDREALLESETRFRGFVQAAPIAAVITDQNGMITLINNQSELLFGYSSSELVGQTVEVLIPASVHERHLQHRKGFIEAPRVRPMGAGIELFALRKDGSEFPVEIQLSYLETDTGILVITFIVDITERKQRERQLRYYASLQESVNDAVISTNLDFVIQSWNHAAEGIYGWRAEEVVDKATSNILRTEFASPELREHILAEFLEQGYWTNEVVQYHKDGHVINILSSTVLLKDENGTPIGIVAVNHNITERKQAEQAMRDSEARYRLLANTINDVVIRFLPSFDYLYVSPSSRAVLGYDPEELIGASDFQRVHPDDAPAIRELIRRLLEHPGSAAITYRFRHKQGHYVWLEGSGRAVVSEQTGEVDEFVFSLRDVTARKAAEAALRESEERYRLLADNINDLITRVDTKGICLYVSPSIRTVLGYEPDELIGQSSFTWIHPDDLAGTIAAQTAALNPNAPQTAITYRNRHKDGHYIWLETSGQIIWTEDHTQMLGFITVSRDISERKRIEDALLEQRDFLQLVVNNVPGLITVKDRAGRFQLANNLSAQIYGTTSLEMVGKTDADFNPNRDEVEWINAKDKETLTSGQSVFIPEETVLDRYYQTNKIPLKRADGIYDRLLVVAADITERKKSEETLRRAFDQEKELGELKSRFVSMASHEFRTPLATILASAETLSAYRLRMTETQIDQRLGNIRGQVDHLKNIIEDVLQLARIQAGRLDFNPTMLNLDGLCRSVIDEFESRPDVTNQLVYSCNDHSREVQLDKKLLRQIINNLVSNAVKYSPDGKKVFISLEYVGDSLIFRVRDQGIGIPEADLNHLFEPFHRAANVGTISGTGLGLSITKEAVELQGGSINVDSQVGVGTAITVTIPISIDSEGTYDENPGH